jgi:hypothetical protein
MRTRRTVKDLLVEAKDAAELMVDLAYAAIFFGDDALAREVLTTWRRTPVERESGLAAVADRILLRLGMPPDERAVVMGAIGNHEERHGEPVSAVGAAVILADKSDVHRSRVRNPDRTTFDIHDRVNYAVEHSFLRVEEKSKTVTLELTIDTAMSQVMDYFEIFLARMLMCRRAATFLGCGFKLQINGVKIL